MLFIISILSVLVLVQGSPVDKITKELFQLSSEQKIKNETDQSKNHIMAIEEATFIRNWPTNEIIDYLGQISGLSFCPKGFLYIFHRADKEMDERSFDENNRYTQEKEGPIRDVTILKMNNRISDPYIVNGFGENIFYLPHGIFADKAYVWTTDLALHQVLRFPHGSKKPDLVLGERFVPGSDKSHFCKPTHAVTASDGSIFVADGYCNSRVIKFDKSGKFLKQFGDGKLSLPHHLAIIESKDLICIADRENNRILCYKAGIKDKDTLGKLHRVIKHSRFGPVYAIAFNTIDNILYVVSGMTNENEKSRVFLYNWDNEIIIGAIDFPGPNGFGYAHTISVCPKQKCIAIGSLTKECPADEETCLDRVEEDERYLSRNIWLYGLTAEDIQLE